MKVNLRGVVWGNVQVEVGPDEGRASREQDVLPAPSLDHFGLPTPARLAGIALAYQVAQKLHACTDPHDPPTERNDRARDVTDLVRLESLAAIDGVSLYELREGMHRRVHRPRSRCSTASANPTDLAGQVVAHPHWRADFASAAAHSGLTVSLDEAVDAVNAWIGAINDARP